MKALKEKSPGKPLSATPAIFTPSNFRKLLREIFAESFKIIAPEGKIFLHAGKKFSMLTWENGRKPLLLQIMSHKR